MSAVEDVRPQEQAAAMTTTTADLSPDIPDDTTEEYRVHALSDTHRRMRNILDAYAAKEWDLGESRSVLAALEGIVRGRQAAEQVTRMSTVTEADNVPVPAGATEVDEWGDVGHPHEFRCFNGPTRTIPGLAWGDEEAVVTIFGTQLRNGTIDGRCIRIGGLHWEDELDSQTARHVAQQLLAAADDLDRLGQR